MAMVLTLLPTMAFAAGEIQVGDNKGDFEAALKEATPGSVLLVNNPILNDAESADTPFVIDKQVTIKAANEKTASLNVRAGGIVLGADVTFENIEFSMTGSVRPAIFANGHTLTANGVTFNENAGSNKAMHIFAGAPSGTSAVAGSKAVIHLTDCKVSNIYAGGMGQNFGGNVDITLNGNCTVGGIYGGGTESISTPSTSNGATGAVNVTLNQFPSNLIIDGEGAGSFNVEAKTIYPTTMTLKNVGQLNVTSGTVELKDGSVVSKVVLSQDAGLDLSKLTSPKIEELSGKGTLSLHQNGAVVIQKVSGNHTLGILSNNGTATTAVNNQPYITQVSGDGKFELLERCKLPNMQLVLKDNVWTATTSSAPVIDTTKVERFAFASKNMKTTASEINNNGAEVKVLVGQADSLTDVPLTIEVNQQSATFNKDFGIYILDNISLEVYDVPDGGGFPEDGVFYFGIKKYNEKQIEKGTYSIHVSAPTRDGGNAEDTFTLTVTDGNTPPTEVKTLTGLRITKQPAKTTYTEGEKFDPTGMEVTADYNDQTSAVIHGYTYSPNTALTRDDKFVTIHYAENGVKQTATVSITVNSKEQTPATITTAPTAKSNLVYNGTEQELINAGTATGGTLQYKLDGGSYSTALPRAKDAKTYTVYYKVVGNADLADVAENSIAVSIARKDVTVAPKSVTIRRGNAIPTFELAYSGLVSGETLKPSDAPKFVCNDKAGNPVSTSTAAGTYTITWTNMQDTNFSDANNYNVTKSATGTLRIETSSSGGSSSSSSSQTTKPTTNKTETTKNTDGSTTKTETKADGTLVKTTTEVNGTTTVIETKKDGTVTETTTTPDGSSVTTKTEPDGSTTTERRDENGSVGTETTDANGKTEIRTTLSENAVSNAKETASPVAAPISVQAEKNSISAPQIHITLPQDAEKTKVEISVSNVSSGTVAILVHEDGTEEILKTSLPTQNGLLIEATGNMTIKIVDNSKDFADTRNHWSREDVNFIASRNLFAGIGNGNFGTKEPMTRGMVNTVLARLNGIETEGGSLWYKNGNDWAQRNGISDGTNPTAAVTREQLATMLYRNAGSPKVIGTLTFADAHSASAYAQNALIWAQQNGILSGVGNHCVAPKATAERAQVAAMLARYLQNAD